MAKHLDILRQVEKYYREKVLLHGPDPLGVDWNSKHSQYIRFEQLSKIFEGGGNLSVLDYGCGYGEFLNYLNRVYDKDSIYYVGYDISPDMIIHAQKNFGMTINATFTNTPPHDKMDYTIASGIFNVNNAFVAEERWWDYIADTIDSIYQLSRKGFSFNALSVYSDLELRKDYLYYADPLKLFDLCKTKYSRNVALLHNYDLYEFTITVKL